jgi:hypothetical protein
MKFNLTRVFNKEAQPAALVALAAYPVLFLTTRDWLMSAMLSGCIGGGVNLLRHRYLDRLAKRARAENLIEWTVEMNGVNVGTITDAEYAAIRLAVFSNTGHYVRQLRNLGRVAFRIFDYCYAGIPIAAFWIMGGLAILEPDVFTSIIAAFQKSGPDAVAQALSVAAQLFIPFAIMIFGMHTLIGMSPRFGFVNQFSEATMHAVRTRCGVAAEGSMQLVRWEHGAATFCDEMACMRGPKR